MKEGFDEFAENLQEAIIRDARAYYTDTVVGLWLNPQNMGPLEQPDGYAQIKGPCGDTMEVFLRINEDRITKATFLTDGCGPSTAAGSMAAQLVTGKTLSEARRLTGDDILNALGGLPEESQHCAILAANTLAEAIQAYLCTEAGCGRDAVTGQKGGPDPATSGEEPRDC